MFIVHNLLKKLLNMYYLLLFASFFFIVVVVACSNEITQGNFWFGCVVRMHVSSGEYKIQMVEMVFHIALTHFCIQHFDDQQKQQQQQNWNCNTKWLTMEMIQLVCLRTESTVLRIRLCWSTSYALQNQKRKQIKCMKKRSRNWIKCDTMKLCWARLSVPS